MASASEQQSERAPDQQPAQQPAQQPERKRGQLGQAVYLVRTLTKHHRRLFITAVTGAAVFGSCTALSSLVIRQVTDDVITPRFTLGSVPASTVAKVLGILILVAFVRAVGVVVRRVWATRTVWRINESLTAEVIDTIAEQPVPWHRRQSAGDLITRAGVDAEAATAVLTPMPYATGVVVLVALSSVLLVVTDPLLGLVAVAIFPFLISINVSYQHRVDRYFDAAQVELGNLSAAVHESFEGVVVVKSFGAEQRETERLAVIASRLREARLGAVRLRATFESVLAAAPTIATIGLLVLGAFRVRSGALTVGGLTSMVYLFSLLVFPLRLIGYALSEVPHSTAGWGRLRSLLDQPIAPDPGARRAASTDHDVVLRDVHYSHDGENAVLAGVDAHIPTGRTVAIVGATGAGKTTLLHLVAGLVAADRGSIAVPVDGVRLVFQEPMLLSGTVRENITLGATVSDDAIDAALAVAEAGFVHELPAGLDTEVGERGVGLSGGQRQRIALARALVRRPGVLLLDDTTSALDPATEAKVLDNLRRALSHTTVVAVASRPSTIALADDVLFIADGRVQDHGSHEQLLQTVPAYRELIEAFEHDRAEIEGSR